MSFRNRIVSRTYEGGFGRIQPSRIIRDPSIRTIAPRQRYSGEYHYTTPHRYRQRQQIEEAPKQVETRTERRNKAYLASLRDRALYFNKWEAQWQRPSTLHRRGTNRIVGKQRDYIEEYVKPFPDLVPEFQGNRTWIPLDKQTRPPIIRGTKVPEIRNIQGRDYVEGPYIPELKLRQGWWRWLARHSPFNYNPPKGKKPPQSQETEKDNCQTRRYWNNGTLYEEKICIKKMGRSNHSQTSYNYRRKSGIYRSNRYNHRSSYAR